MKNRLYFMVLMMWAITSCTKHNIPGSSFTPSGLEYKILFLGDETEKPQKGETVKVNWQLLNKFGKHAQSGVLSVEYTGEQDAGFQEVLSNLYIGDSAVFIADSGAVAEFNIRLPRNNMAVTVKPFAVADTVEERYESQFPGITAGVKSKADRAFFEVLDTLKNKPVKEINGMYMFMIRTQTGPGIKTGDEVKLHYEGFLLNGKKMDSTFDRGEVFWYFAGDPDQLIEGVNTAVSTMKAGDEAVLVIPPHMAFGSGWGSGIVPPQSTVVYYVKVVNVKSNKLKS